MDSPCRLSGSLSCSSRSASSRASSPAIRRAPLALHRAASEGEAAQRDRAALTGHLAAGTRLSPSPLPREPKPARRPPRAPASTPLVFSTYPTRLFCFHERHAVSCRHRAAPSGSPAASKASANARETSTRNEPLLERTLEKKRRPSARRPWSTRAYQRKDAEGADLVFGIARDSRPRPLPRRGMGSRKGRVGLGQDQGHYRCRPLRPRPPGRAGMSGSASLEEAEDAPAPL